VALSPDGALLLTRHDREIRLWTLTLPPQERGDAVTLWVQALTGLEVAPEEETVTKLTPDAWKDRCRRYEEAVGLVGPK
jgi:hypothetical protein